MWIVTRKHLRSITFQKREKVSRSILECIELQFWKCRDFKHIIKRPIFLLCWMDSEYACFSILRCGKYTFLKKMKAGPRIANIENAGKVSRIGNWHSTQQAFPLFFPHCIAIDSLSEILTPGLEKYL